MAPFEPPNTWHVLAKQADKNFLRSLLRCNLEIFVSDCSGALKLVEHPKQPAFDLRRSGESKQPPEAYGGRNPRAELQKTTSAGQRSHERIPLSLLASRNARAIN